MEEVQQNTPGQEQPLTLLVTVIIVSYRRGAVLRSCLEALEKSKDRERLQIIVLDAGNYDTTTQYDLDFPANTFLRMPRNFGASKALNIGIRSAKAGLLFFLDPAIQVQPDTIPKLVEALESIPEAGAVMPLLTNSSGAAVPQTRTLPDRDTLWKAWQDDAGLPMSIPSTQQPLAIEFPGRRALLIRLPFLKGMNYFDENYGEWGGDLELAFQIKHAGRKAILIPDIKVLDISSTEKPLPWSSGQRATLAADRLSGTAHFLGKRLGFMPELMIRLQAILVTLLRALTFQNPGYNWSLLSNLIGGSKIDGSQGGV